MERADFLKLAHKVSQLKGGVLGIKKKVPAEMQVAHDGIQYYPIGYEMKFEQGKTLHLAILHELTANSVIYAPLDRVTAWS